MCSETSYAQRYHKAIFSGRNFYKDTTGNNTHNLMKVIIPQWYPTLWDPIDCRSSVHGILQAGILEWVAILFSSHNLIVRHSGSKMPFLAVQAAAGAISESGICHSPPSILISVQHYHRASVSIAVLSANLQPLCHTPAPSSCCPALHVRAACVCSWKLLPPTPNPGFSFHWDFSRENEYLNRVDTL